MARPSRKTGGKRQGNKPKGRGAAGSASPNPEPTRPYSLAVLVAPGPIVTPAPKGTKEFLKAADGNPRLRDELGRLLGQYSEDELVALAGALFESFGVACSLRRRRGPRPLAVPARADEEAQVGGALIADRAECAGLNRRAFELRAMKTQAVERVAPLLPLGARESARHERANKLVEAYVKAPPSTTRLPTEVARKLAELLGKKDGNEK